MDGFGSHTFKLLNKEGHAVYCKFHAKTAQGIRNLSAKQAGDLAGSDPDYATRDLFNAIEAGDYPQWNFYIQVGFLWALPVHLLALGNDIRGSRTPPLESVRRYKGLAAR